MKNKPLKIKITPTYDNPEFFQKETGVTHTSFSDEKAFYSLIQNGDIETIKILINRNHNNELIVGRLSNNSLRQSQYWAVCCITLGTRFAILGGLDEMTAYNLSDKCIMDIDRLTSSEEIIEYILKGAIELTELVNSSKHKPYSFDIQKCINYIHNHLHENISIQELTNEIGFSKSSLSSKFKNEVGKTIHEYILEQKLNESKKLLKLNKKIEIIAYSLGFCSQTHYIQCFKKEYGITPYQYKMTR